MRRSMLVVHAVTRHDDASDPCLRFSPCSHTLPWAVPSKTRTTTPQVSLAVSGAERSQLLFHAAVPTAPIVPTAKLPPSQVRRDATSFTRVNFFVC